MNAEYSADARNDLRDVFDYLIEHASAAIAERVIREITGQCDRLAENPGMGRSREELRPGLRSFVQGRYVIFYKSSASNVAIVRILHGARDIETIFRPSEN